jgi:chromosomal replication initiator protein
VQINPNIIPFLPSKIKCRHELKNRVRKILKTPAPQVARRLFKYLLAPDSKISKKIDCPYLEHFTCQLLQHLVFGLPLQKVLHIHPFTSSRSFAQFSLGTPRQHSVQRVGRYIFPYSMRDKKELWSSILTRISQTIPYPKFITWFKHTAILEVDKELLVIGVPIPMGLEWMSSNYRDEILKTAQEFVPAITQVNFKVDTSLANNDDPRHITQELFSRTNPESKTRKRPGQGEVFLSNTEGLTSKIINPKFTLENFIVGTENRLAHAACSAVASGPGQRYNPLFIFGPTGLGKTHLLMGTANEILRRYNNKIVLYTTSEAFGNDYIFNMRKNKMEQFNNRYRKVDAFIIDDIQFLSGKTKTEETFFHTFNALYDAGKQIIIASDRSPKELNELDRRLTGRFEMGMVCDVQFPDYETRLSILQEKVHEHKSIIDPAVLEFIAKNVTQSVRELEGVMMQAIAEAELEQSTPTVRSVERVLRKLAPRSDVIDGSEDGSEIKKASTDADVLHVVAQYYNVTPDLMISETRKQEISLPRQIAMYIMKQKLSHSLVHIGQVFGGRNHTTAMHSVRNIKTKIRRDVNLHRDINALCKEMGLV